MLPGPERGQDTRGGGLGRPAHAYGVVAARLAAWVRLVVAPVA